MKDDEVFFHPYFSQKHNSRAITMARVMRGGSTNTTRTFILFTQRSSASAPCIPAPATSNQLSTAYHTPVTDSVGPLIRVHSLHLHVPEHESCHLKQPGQRMRLGDPTRRHCGRLGRAIRHQCRSVHLDVCAATAAMARPLSLRNDDDLVREYDHVLFAGMVTSGACGRGLG